MKLIQTLLVRDGTELVAWLPLDPKVKVGSIISLDAENNIRWRVAQQYTVQDADAIQTKWGLKLPESQRTER